jgi:hypothetical protein
MDRVFNPTGVNSEVAVKATRGAAVAGVIAGAKGGTIAGAAVYGAHRFWPGFRRGVGLSGKVAMVVTGVFFNFVLAGEK